MRVDYIEQGDCLKLMSNIPDNSVDLILCDLPYGKTRNSWDRVIPFKQLWEHYCRIIKERGCIALFCDGLFMIDLIASNKKMWRYNIVWDKCLPSGFLNANKMPLRSHEEIAIFYNRPPTYNPQKHRGMLNHSQGKTKKNTNNNYGEFAIVDNKDKLGELKHPRSIWRFPKPHPSTTKHPTEKPVALLECLIKTYTNEGDIVLDNCMGSGSTCVAAVKTNRHYIGFEIEDKYFEIADNRIKEAEKALTTAAKGSVKDAVS